VHVWWVGILIKVGNNYLHGHGVLAGKLLLLLTYTVGQKSNIKNAYFLNALVDNAHRKKCSSTNASGGLLIFLPSYQTNLGWADDPLTGNEKCLQRKRVQYPKRCTAFLSACRHCRKRHISNAGT